MEGIDLVICIGIKIYNSMRKHKVYILQMYSQTIPSKLIKFFTHYKYSHIAISFDKNCNVIYSFGRTKYNSILNGGFVKENKNGEFFNYYKNKSGISPHRIIPNYLKKTEAEEKIGDIYD